MALYPVILAGGGGSRLWPLSRQNKPKQFLDLLEQGQSLLQSTIERARCCSEYEPLVIANKQHRFELSQQLKAVNLPISQVILEPVAKNTAPSILVAALHLYAKDPSAQMLVLPADHYLPEISVFKQTMALLDYADFQDVYLLAIKPSSANTQYGYIQLTQMCVDNVYEVAGFIEKPHLKQAQALFEGGSHYWNSGIVIASAGFIIELFKQYQPQLVCSVQLAYKQSMDFYGYTLLGEAFDDIRAIAFDNAILENSAKIKALKYHGEWDDLGNWQQLLQRRESLSLGSSISSSGKVNLIIGLNDVLVVDDDDVLVVASKDAIDQLAHAAQLLQKLGRTDLLSRLDVCRPWGSFKVLASGDGFLVKHLHVAPHCQISLQSHASRIEHWVVVKGVALAERQGCWTELLLGDGIKIEKNQRHRLKNNQEYQLEIIEVQVGQDLSESDIVRYDDDYQRHLEE